METPLSKRTLLSSNPLFLSNFFFVQILKTREPPNFRGEETMYKDHDYKIKLLCILLLTSEYIKSYDDKTECIYYLIEDDELLKECNKTQNIDKNTIRKVFYGKPA